MAQTYIDSEELILVDLWPGYPDSRLGTPKDGFTGADHHNVVAPAYPIGSKIQYYNAGTAGKAGYATFIYLKLEMQDTSNVLAARHLVNLHTDAKPYDVTNENASVITETYGPVAIGISAMTVDYYGWFWCGGVCPEDAVAALGGTYATDTNVTAGCRLVTRDAGTTHPTWGEIEFGIAAADTEEVVGYSLATDRTAG
jgi:hypothetical protein